MSKLVEPKNYSRRERFLESEWVKYPDAMNLKLAGRIVAFDSLCLTLFCGMNGGASKVLFKGIKNWAFWKDILILGDIVGFLKDGECVLLAPNRTLGILPPQLVVEKIERQVYWNRFLRCVNLFFEARGFLSVSTPTLVDNPGPEPSIDVFKTEFKNGRSKKNKYLITSPELHLKKIISETLSPVYEIAKVFRNNEHSNKHHPEFLMLEWYRPFANLDEINQDVKDLILYLIKKLDLNFKKPKFEFTTFKDILKKNYQFEFTSDTNAEQFRQLLKQQKIYFSESMSLDDLFTLVNIELIEPKLNRESIVFLNNYPPYAAALAKIGDGGWAQRFEVYWHDLELGNAFYELNDPEIQEQRLIEDNLKKQINGLESLPLDKEFLDSLRRGLPPTAGISIGLERLFMALFQESDIKNLRWFSLT